MWCSAALVPVPSGLTVPLSPCTTARSMPSLTKGVSFGEPNTRSLFVSFPVISTGTGCSA